VSRDERTLIGSSIKEQKRYLREKEVIEASERQNLCMAIMKHLAATFGER
jgi:hypothetical protein